MFQLKGEYEIIKTLDELYIPFTVITNMITDSSDCSTYHTVGFMVVSTTSTRTPLFTKIHVGYEMRLDSIKDI